MLVLAVMVVAAAVLLLVLGQVRKRRIVALEAEGLARFKSFYADRGLPAPLVSNVYHYLAENAATGVQHFDVNPTDDLGARYGIVSEVDVQDAVVVIADRAGLKLPKAQELDLAQPTVHTVEDLLRFLEPLHVRAA
jgi:hypothetical protein